MFKKVLIVSSLIITAMSVFFAINEQAIAKDSQVPSTIAKAAELDPTKLNVDLLKAKIKAKLGLIVDKVEKTPIRNCFIDNRSRLILRKL